jgi:carboxypeptidase Taq
MEILHDRFAEITDLGRARALLDWDERTQMPPGGAEARSEQVATLTRVRHQLLVADELAAVIDRAAAEVDGEAPGSVGASLVRAARRKADKARRVPVELRTEMTRAASLGEHAWGAARAASDFGAFLPHLEHAVELKRRYVECFAPYDHPYDPLLDDYEPEMTVAEIQPVLFALRDGLVPLIERLRAGNAPDASCLHGEFPAAQQRELAEWVLADLPLPEAEWRLDGTVHPFATAIAPSDVRITTRFEENYLGAALWAVIHEAGHAMYENGIDPRLHRSPLCRGASMGFHESQSRLWENWVGRSRPYLQHLLPRLRELFPAQFGAVDVDGLYRAANRVEPSLIRVEADEVTYNLHIALRFELELEIITGSVELRDLPEVWAERMDRYLGIAVPDDANGVLQDVHWAAGLFGYFPTYSLGNVIAGQIWERVRAELPDLDEQLERGEPAPLRDWLAREVYRHGAAYLPGELIQRVAGGPLDVAPLLGQLEAKFTDIYGV